MLHIYALFEVSTTRDHHHHPLTKPLPQLPGLRVGSAVLPCPHHQQSLSVAPLPAFQDEHGVAYIVPKWNYFWYRSAGTTHNDPVVFWLC